MRNKLSLIVAVGMAAGLTTVKAVTITHTATDLVTGGVVASPPFGALASGGTVGTAAIGYGVDYTFGGIEGIFDDPPYALGGINSGGLLDLLTAVDGRIVLPSTTISGLTSYLMAEAGNAADGSLTLEAFDINGMLLASVLNGPPDGPAGRTTFTIDRMGVFDIASFRIYGADTFGVNQIWIESPVEARSSVPDSSQFLLPLAGVFLIGIRRFFRA